MYRACDGGRHVTAATTLSNVREEGAALPVNVDPALDLKNHREWVKQVARVEALIYQWIDHKIGHHLA